MRDVAIIGVGMTPVGEHWNSSLRALGTDALRLALENSNLAQIEALYVGNAYGATYSSQTQAGALIADHSDLGGLETFTIEAGDASGAAALRIGYLAVASGAVDTVAVLGVEKSTDSLASSRVSARNVSLDADFETVHGATLTTLAALLMRRYMFEYGIELSAFEGFSLNAHANGSRNQYAMYRNVLRAGAFGKAPMVAEPVSLFDSAPDGDGAAAVILTSRERAADLVETPVWIAGSGAASDTLALQDRQDILYLKAADASAFKAYQQAGLTAADIDLFEMHDAFTILSALTLEATGFAQRGEGWKLAQQNGEMLGLGGHLPVSTFGGLKSRGNPAGATGIYQAVEACLQLRQEAGSNQVPNARVACIQNLGGLGSTALTHILVKDE